MGLMACSRVVVDEIGIVHGMCVLFQFFFWSTKKEKKENICDPNLSDVPTEQVPLCRDFNQSNTCLMFSLDSSLEHLWFTSVLPRPHCKAYSRHAPSVKKNSFICYLVLRGLFDFSLERWS